MKKNKSIFNKYHLFGMLLCLAFLFILAQASFFIVHYKLSGLFDSFASYSLTHQIIHPVILLPIIKFILIQLIAYLLVICWIWFISVSTGALFGLSKRVIYFTGIGNWLAFCALILILNSIYFPDSMFAISWRSYEGMTQVNDVLLIVILAVFTLFTWCSCIYFFLFKRTQDKRYRAAGKLILLSGLGATVLMVSDRLFVPSSHHLVSASKPNIIFIGLDSLRPDVTNDAINSSTQTPHIDRFLQSSVNFAQAYTPLSRTFPAWISILTGKYPKHHAARNNLVDQAIVLTNETVAHRLKQAGYETIYATDEKRFSNITEAYGFDRVIGPGMGVNDFILGGLNDFPLSNLLINLPGGRFLFPYNHANRAAHITYEPDVFLHLVRAGLAKRTDKPLFLAVHLCLSHWPFTWARDGQRDDFVLSERYRSSVHAVDQQFGQLLQVLKENGLLENSLVVLLSDHGTTVGLPGDRIVIQQNYRGAPEKLRLIAASKLDAASQNSLDMKHDYVIHTSYGQGNDVLSLKQNQVLLAFKGFGIELPAARVQHRVLLMDIAPTILDFLHLAPLPRVDGVSLSAFFFGETSASIPMRPVFLETGDKVIDTETDKIVVEKVLKQRMSAYEVNTAKGLLVLNPAFEKTAVKNKQRAILFGDWLLARYPSEARLTLALLSAKENNRVIPKPYVIPPYFVLVNVKTGQWTIGLSSPFAKTAPVKDLLQQFNAFYGDELM